jgi:GNAT superfamily N-acetyltransferase
MSVNVETTDDPRLALSATRAFLTSRPVEHNLIATMLDTGVDEAHGRYWWVLNDGAVEAVAVQLPPDQQVQLTPCSPAVVAALLDAITLEGVEASGVFAEAATAATFAGQWAERRHIRARPVDGGRLYRVDKLTANDSAPGDLRLAGLDDHSLATDWLAAFYDTGPGPHPDPAAGAADAISGGRLAFWEDGEQTVAVAGAARPVAGVTRVRWVYTPPEHRRRGYGTAMVAALTAVLLKGEADTCILYTQLENPTSNAIYQRLGYRAASEVLTYRLG